MSPNDLRATEPLDPERVSRAPAPAAPPAKPARAKRKPVRFWRGVFKLALIGGAVVAIGGGVAGYGLYREIEAGLPDYHWLADYQPPQMSRIFAGDSRLMAELATERRIFVPLEAIPQRVQQAFVSAEDQNFWHHQGVDPIAVLRAVVTNIEQYGTGHRAIGASTITQQVAKNMLVGADRTLLRKAREAILAIRIEATLPKTRVLELYLNEIFLGQSAYGVAAAAQNYFNKSLDELTLAEAAFLAALPKAPNNYNPFRFPEAARSRRDWVIDRMLDDGAVTAEEARRAKAEPIVPRPTRRPDMVSVGGYFTEEVRRELVTRFGAEQTTTGGLVVRTSLDPRLQAITEGVLRQHLMAYDRRRGGWHGVLGHISPAATDWLPQLDAFPHPGGGMAEWRLAVALDVRGTEARFGWIERPDPRGAPQPRTGTLAFEDVSGWARPVLREGRLGGLPRRMADVVAPGDLVFIEPNATQQPGRGTAREGRVALRQMPQVEGAIAALDPQTGRVMAMAGGWSYDRSQFNRVTQAMRQPGSSFKPFVYLAALENGIPPTQRFLDGPIEISTPQGIWRPGNYGDRTSGAYVTMREALARSLNLVTIRIAQEVGIDRVADVASRFGVIPNMPRVLSMALGAGETTVLRQAAGYAAFANGGRAVTPTVIDSVQDRNGRVIWRPDVQRCGECRRGFDAGPPEVTVEGRRATDAISAYQITNLLTGVVQRGTGTAAGRGLNRPIAGKTGTTNDYYDNWFVGFTPDMVVAVWVGFDDPRSLGDGETGGGNAAPIFHDVLEAALRNSPAVPFRAPPGVALVSLGGGITEAFQPGTENAAQPPASGGGGGGGGRRRSGGGGGGDAEGMGVYGGSAALDSGGGGLY